MENLNLQEIKRIDKEDDIYRIFEVDNTVDSSIIVDKYKEIAPKIKSWLDEAKKSNIGHRNSEDVKRTTRVFEKISNAFQIITDEKKRREYDNSILKNQPKPNFHDLLSPDELYRKKFKNSAENRDNNTTGTQNQPQQEQGPQRGAPRFNIFSKIINNFRLIFFIIFLLYTMVSNSSIDFKFRIHNPISRNGLKGIISFTEFDSQRYQKKSPKYGVAYSIPSWWINSVSRSYSFWRDVGKVADQLYEEELQIQCELEKNRNIHDGNACKKMKKILNM